VVNDTATGLSSLNDAIPRSAVRVGSAEVGLVGPTPRLAVLAPAGSPLFGGFEGEFSAHGDRILLLGPTSASNLNSLRKLLPWLCPRPLGTRASAGFGDRLGLATPSHLEALRVAAVLDPDLFRGIYNLARERYETDRASYHVSAEMEHAPADPGDAELPTLLEQFDAREILHVTFGSVLDEPPYLERLFALLRGHSEDYASGLETHFLRHLEPFAPGGTS
jgi:tagaturonate epimerase